MNGRVFLGPARDLVAVASEAHWRTAAGRAYYAAFQEARAALERWGVIIPARESIHAAVRLRFVYAGDPDAKAIGRGLDDLVKLRNEADYKLTSSVRFRDANDAEDAIDKADDLIDRLDAIDADPTRRAEAIASIRP